MEEYQWVKILTIFIRSNDVQELTLQIFDSSDILIANLRILNYSTHTIHVKNCLKRFYCIATNHHHNIEEQFQVKLNEEQEPKSVFQYSKKFKGFSVSIQIEDKKSLQKDVVFDKFIKEQSEFAKFANTHLRKLQNTVFKKIQVEQLKKPLPQKHHGKNSSRKLNKTLTFKKLPKQDQKQYLANKSKDLEFTLKTLSKAKCKPSESSQRSDQSLMMTTVPAVSITNRKKHNTLFQQSQLRKTEMSIKQLNQEEKISEDYYQQFIQALEYSYNRFQTNRRIQTIRRSHNQLEMSTIIDIQRQKKAFQVIKTMRGKYSQQNSPEKIITLPRKNNMKKSSPYFTLNSTAFLKRKVR